MSNSDTSSIRTDEATLQKREAITQAMEEYIAGNPEHRGFIFFLPSSQDIQLIKHAAATMSLRIGKPIDVVYPYEGHTNSQEKPPHA